MCKMLMNAYFEQEYERNIEKARKLKEEREFMENQGLSLQKAKEEKQGILQKLFNAFK